MQKTTFFVQNVNHQVHIRHCPEVKTEFCQTFSKPCFSAKMHHFNKKKYLLHLLLIIPMFKLNTCISQYPKGKCMLVQ